MGADKRITLLITVVAVLIVVFYGLSTFITADSGKEEDEEFNKNAVQTEGVITNVSKDTGYTGRIGSKNRRTETVYTYGVKYQIKGGVYCNSSFTKHADSYKEGDVITIYYDSENPAEVTTELKEPEKKTSLNRIIGLFIIGIGIYGGFYSYKKIKTML